MRKRLFFPLKLVLSAVFLGILFRTVEPGSVRWFLDASPAVYGWWLGALVLQVLLLGLQAGTWRLLFTTEGPLSPSDSLLGTLVVYFAGTFTPGRFSARLSAPFVFHALEPKQGLGFSTGVVYLHTACYLAAYGLAGGVGMLLLAFGPPVAAGYLLAVPVLLYLIAGGGLLYGAMAAGTGSSGGDSTLLGLLPSRWTEVIRNQTRHLERLTEDRTNLAAVFFLLFVSVSILPGLRMYLLFRSAGLEPSPFALMFLLPAFYSVTILPISLGGIGLAEGSAVSMFALLGGSSSVILPLVLLDRTLAVYLPALAGWVGFMATSPKTPDTVRNATSCGE